MEAAADVRSEIARRRLDAKARARYWSHRAQRAAQLDRVMKVGIGLSASSALGAWAFTSIPYLWQALCAGAAGGAFASPFATDPGRAVQYGNLAGQWLAREGEWDALWRRAAGPDPPTPHEVAAAADKDAVVQRAAGDREKARGLAKVRAEVEALEGSR